MFDPTHVEEAFAEWIQQSDWNESYLEFLTDFYADYYEMTGEDAHEVLQALPDEVAMEAFDCTLEHFATRGFEDKEGNSENPVTSFLTEQGESLSPEDRAYMAALRDSKGGMYEVQAIENGTHLVLQNVLESRAEPVRVESGLAEFDSTVGTTFFARIVALPEGAVLSLGYLDLSPEIRGEIVEMFEATVKEYLRDVPKLIRKDPSQVRSARAQVLDGLPPIATGLWIDEMSRVYRETGDMAKSFFEIDGDTAAIAAALDNKFERQEADMSSWAAVEDGHLVAAIAIQDRFLMLAAKDEEGLARVQAQMKELLGDRIGEPKVLDDEDESE